LARSFADVSLGIYEQLMDYEEIRTSFATLQPMEQQSFKRFVRQVFYAVDFIMVNSLAFPPFSQDWVDPRKTLARRRSITSPS
jgi:hypothetical protein